jgi:chromosome segregation ATPase
MEKLATVESVWSTCDRLTAEGRKITGRAVVAEIGGSLSTVLQLIKSWRDRNNKVSETLVEIPNYLQESFRRALATSALEAVDLLKTKIDEAASREAEAIDALEKCEAKIVFFEGELDAAIVKIAGMQQSSEKERAVALETTTGLRRQIEKLEQDNDLLVRSGEAARVDAAKSAMQVDRADKAAEKAEAKLSEMETQIIELVAQKTAAEKGQAVAEQHSQDLTVLINKLEVANDKSETKIASLESANASLARDINAACLSQQKAETAVEQMAIRLKDSTEIINFLKMEVKRTENTVMKSSSEGSFLNAK